MWHYLCDVRWVLSFMLPSARNNRSRDHENVTAAVRFCWETPEGYWSQSGDKFGIWQLRAASGIGVERRPASIGFTEETESFGGCYWSWKISLVLYTGKGEAWESLLKNIPRLPRPHEQRQIGNFQAVSFSPLCAWSAVNRIVCALSKLCGVRNLETGCPTFEHVQTGCCGRLKRWVGRIPSVQFFVIVYVSSAAQKICKPPKQRGLDRTWHWTWHWTWLQLHQLTLCSVAAPDAQTALTLNGWSCEGNPEAENVALLHD